MVKFSNIINAIKNYKEHTMFSMKSSTKTKKIYKYNASKDIKTDLVLRKKLQNCSNMYEDCDLEPYDVEYYDKGCIEYLDANIVNWNDIENAINNLEIINNNTIDPKEINANCDLDIHQLVLDDGNSAYILNKHTTIGSAFNNKTVFCKRERVYEEQILAFSDYADVIIYDGNCYILHEDKFNSIFHFRQKLDNEVKKGKEEIESWTFLDNPQIFYEECDKNYNTKRAIVKVLNKKGLEFLKKATPKQIKAKIKKHKELNDLTFDANDKMIITPESTKIILKILTNKIGLDLFTESIFGTEGKNNIEIS